MDPAMLKELEGLRAQAGSLKWIAARIPFTPAELARLRQGHVPKGSGEKWALLPRPDGRLWAYRFDGGQARFFWDLGFEDGPEPGLSEVLAPAGNFEGAYLKDERMQVGYAWTVLEWIGLERNKACEPPQFASVAEKLLRSKRSWAERLETRDRSLQVLSALVELEALAVHPGLDAELPRWERNRLWAFGGAAALLSFYLAWFVGLPVLAWALGSWGRRRGKPWREHPLAGQLDAQNPGTSLEIDGELRQGAEVFGGLLLTRHWLLERRYFGLEAVDLLDLAWAYARVTEESINGVSAGKHTQLIVHLCNRQRPYKLRVPSADAGAVLERLQARFPWAVYGYDQALYTEMDLHPQRFRDAVIQRRRETTEHGGGR